MKITDFKKEDLEKGVALRRKVWGGNTTLKLYTDNVIFNIYTRGSGPETRKNLTIDDITSDDWEVVEEEKKYWKPEQDETYYYITTRGAVFQDIFCAPIDESRADFGNAFKTKEEAEHMAEKLKIIHELQKFIYENNEEVDWSDMNQYKYDLVYDYGDKAIRIEGRLYSNIIPFNLFFTSEELAYRAVDVIGKDRIKKYYFDVED